MQTFLYMKRYLCRRHLYYVDIYGVDTLRDVIALVKCNLCGHILTGNGTYTDIFLRGNSTYAGLEESKRWVEEASKSEDTPSNDEDEESDDNSCRQREESSVEPKMFKMRRTDGSTIEVPKDWAEHMAAVSKKIDELQSSIQTLTAQMLPHPTANSTRLEPPLELPQRRVTFMSTTPATTKPGSLPQRGRRNSLAPRRLANEQQEPPRQRPQQIPMNSGQNPSVTPISRQPGFGDGYREGGRSPQ